MLPGLERLLTESSAKESKEAKKAAAEDSKSKDKDSTDKTVLINQQMALLSMDTLAQCFCGAKFGAASNTAFLNVFPTVMRYLNHANAQVAYSALMALGSFVSGLKLATLPYLPKFFPDMLTILERTLQSVLPLYFVVVCVALLTSLRMCCVLCVHVQSKPGTAAPSSSRAFLQQTLLTTINAVVTAIPSFLTPYIPRLLFCLLHPGLDAVEEEKQAAAPAAAAAAASTSAAASTASAGSKRKSEDKVAHPRSIPELLSAISLTLTEHIEPRLLLPHVFSALPKCITLGDESLRRLFSLVAHICTHLSTESTKEHYHALFRFFLTAFDVRRKCGSKVCFVSLCLLQAMD
jgi:U3 small nucleolar RNA-associated protein 10